MSTSFMHDRMVRRIMRREGDSAFATLVETLSYIYAGKGYYISVGDEFYEELVDSLYSTELDDVKRIISLSVEYGLFDVGLFRQYNILTSADIQRQYLFIMVFLASEESRYITGITLPCDGGWTCV